MRSIEWAQALSQRDRQLRWALLGLCAAPFAIAGAIHLGWQMPFQHCLFQTLFHVPSPTCGLTRSLLVLLRGDWQQSLAYHVFGSPVLLVCIGLIVQTSVELWHGRSLKIAPHQTLMGLYQRLLMRRDCLAIVLGPLFGYYLLRLYARYTVGWLPFQWDQTPLWQGLVRGANWL